MDVCVGFHAGFCRADDFRRQQKMARWWFQIFFIFTPNLGKDSHFDEHIFQMGWFNHQLDGVVFC